MKQLLVVAVVLLCCFTAKAQIVFRNGGPDTIRIAVGTFYDTTSKGVRQPEYRKAIMTKGWYKLYPGDSLVAGALIGPAVYYTVEHIKRNLYIVGDTFPVKTNDLRANYRESLYISGYDLKDTAKFLIKHPYTPRGAGMKVVSGFFRVVLVPEQAKKERRLLIAIDQRQQGG